MRIDPTIDRIRKIRHEISEECNHDTRKIIEYYMKYQQKYADRLMNKGKNLTIRSSGDPANR